MAIREKMHRLLAGLIGAAGLAYPACAAVCPRGIGGCPFPGRCFLFIDANAVCDYTRTSASGGGSLDPATPTTTSAPVSAATTPPPLPAPSGTGAAGFASAGALLAGTALFLVTAGAVFALLRSGRLGPRASATGAALALSSFFALGVGGIATYLLSGEAASASLFATAWLLAGTSALFGFAVLAPLMPVEFVGLVTVAAGGGALLTPGVAGILGGIALAFAVGRTFCGHVCPVGAVQELAYAAPVPKHVVRHPRSLEAVRAGVFAASVAAALSHVNVMAYTGVYDFFSLTVAAALSHVNVMAYTGVYDFFSLTVSAGLAVFAGLLALSAVVYRGLCPFGLLFSLPAHVSRLRLRRTGACINCRKCERACLAGVAGRGASKRECYLCGRCTETCPVDGALAYTVQRT